jgi:hypothetical protein
VGAKIQAGTGTFPVSVAIEDGNGTTLSNDNTDTVTLALNKSNGAKLSCTGGLTATVSSGVASFTGCTIDKAARNYQLVVTSSVTPALTSPTGNSFDVTAGAASQLVFTSSPLTGPASSAANLGPVTVQEEDAAGNAVDAGSGGVNVSLSANPSSGAVFSGSSGGSSVTSVTIPAGSAAASFYVGDSNNGSPVVTASATGLTSATQTETIQAVQLKITSNQVSGPASSTATIGPIKVQLQTADGTPVTTGTSLTLSSSSAGPDEFSADPGGTPESTITIPAGSSKASFYYGDEVAGKPTITVAGSGGLSDTQKVTVTPAAAAGLVFSNVNVSSSKNPNGKSAKLACTGLTANISCTINPEVPAGTGRTLSAQVSLVDQFGNTVSPGSDVSVVLTGTGGLSVTSPVTIAASSSSATFTGSLPDATGSATPVQGTVTATATVGSASLSAALTS